MLFSRMASFSLSYPTQCPAAILAGGMGGGMFMLENVFLFANILSGNTGPK